MLTWVDSRLRAVPLLVVLTLAALLAGCSTGGGPSAPVQSNEGTLRERALTPSSYTVQRGDTIYGVARQFDLSVRALIDANGLQPPFQLTVGQVLALPAGGDYLVARGDTLSGIAHKTGVPFATLARINELSAPYGLKVGQRLKLPGAGNAMATGPQVIQSPMLAAAAAPAAASARAPSMAPPAAAASPQRAGGYTTLAERDAKAQGSAPPPATAPPAAPIPAAAAPPSPQPAPAEPQVASALAAAPATKRGHGFIWPVKGEVIAEFGSPGKGQHNDGINIAVARGTPVVAAEDGVVAYAGNELRGFGNLLLIKHAEGWMTAYAHNDALLVKRGDVVKRGQRIAKVGDSGGVSPPQLHFELRQGTRAVDPMTALGGKAIPASSPVDPPDPG